MPVQTSTATNNTPLPSATFTPEPTVTSTPEPTPTPVGPIEIPANPEKGFKWSYLLYVPSKTSGGHILVVPNNTGHRDNDISVHRAFAKSTLSSRISWAKELEVPLLVPVFPRFDDESDGTIASQYLGRGSLEKSWQNKYPDIAREDLQLVAMIDDARIRLASLNVKVDEKIFIEGYSASAMFTSRFTILHPERVQASVFGGHGWPIVPVDKWETISLPYPYGTGDIEKLTGMPFSLEEFRRVAIFVYMGEADDNGWALPWYIGGNERSYYSNFKNIFGISAKELSDSASRIYQELNCSAVFMLFPNQDHQSAFMTLDSEILDFFQEHK